jgi:GH24 family phage-related lysozyme (muramidase)
VADIRLANAAKAYKGLSHQTAALNWLQEQIPSATLAQFADLYRADPPAKPEASPSPGIDWLTPCLPLVKEFEGCRLDAYLCPAGVWTIGWGHTGPEVKQGLRWTQQQADAALAADLHEAHAGMLQALPMARSYSGPRQAALTSWVFNIGASAAADSTLRRRLAAGEDPATVVREELPRWNKGGSGVLPGLVRRRAAEVALFAGGPAGAATAPQVGKVRPSDPFSTRLTPHITLGEFALGQEVRRFQQQHQVDTAAELAAFLERVRSRFGKPVIITSGYRPPAINASVGGASGSEHLYNAPGVGAVDFYVDGASIQVVQDWCDKEWPYSLGYGALKGFVHLGIRQGRPRVRWDY